MNKSDYLKMLFNIKNTSTTLTLENISSKFPIVRHILTIAFVIDNDGNKLKIFKEESDTSFRDRCIGKENKPTSYDYVQIETTLDSEYLELNWFNKLRNKYKIQYFDDYTEEKLILELKEFEKQITKLKRD